MKKRDGYVSNSSSSSCLILNWSSLSERKKEMIENYWEFVPLVWKSYNLPISEDGDCLNKDSIPDEDEDTWELADKLDFGYVDKGWSRLGKEGKTLRLWTSIDNFSMSKWLDFIGGIEYIQDE